MQLLDRDAFEVTIGDVLRRDHRLPTNQGAFGIIAVTRGAGAVRAGKQVVRGTSIHVYERGVYLLRGKNARHGIASDRLHALPKGVVQVEARGEEQDREEQATEQKRL